MTELRMMWWWRTLLQCTFIIITLLLKKKTLFIYFANSLTISPAPNAKSIDKAVPDDARDISVKDVEMKDVTANETQLKSADDLPIANQDLEVDLFLHGITDHVKWRELVSKWQAFENDYPIKGVLYFFLFSF